MRHNQRRADELRAVHFTPDFTKHAEGSVLAIFGETRVLCTATVEESVPPFLRGQGRGWVTAEYAMLPRSTHSRVKRETVKPNGRSQEIQRLIGRSLRAVMDFEALGERQIILDCDVIQADGGTRTASISGAFVALSVAAHKLVARGIIEHFPIKESLAAVSVGMIDDEVLLDLDYEEDKRCESDVNIVMTASGNLVEIQGTAEAAPFSRAHLTQMLDYAGAGIAEIIQRQHEVLYYAFKDDRYKTEWFAKKEAEKAAKAALKQ